MKRKLISCCVSLFLVVVLLMSCCMSVGAYNIGTYEVHGHNMYLSARAQLWNNQYNEYTLNGEIWSVINKPVPIKIGMLYRFDCNGDDFTNEIWTDKGVSNSGATIGKSLYDPYSNYIYQYIYRDETFRAKAEFKASDGYDCEYSTNVDVPWIFG